MIKFERVFLVLVGIIIGTLIFAIPKFKWEWNIKLTDLLQIIIAIIIGYKIQHYTTVKFNQSRIVKDQIERRIKDTELAFKALTSQVEFRFNGEPTTPQKIFDAKRDFSNAVHLLERAITVSNLQSNYMVQLKDQRKKYIDLVTGFNFPVEPYSMDVYSKSRVLQLPIMETLLNISVEINNLN